jgi:hypothetical protein
MSSSRTHTLALWNNVAVAAAVLVAGALSPRTAAADEGGVSFWVPGFVSSLAAVPATPGFAFVNIFYHDSVSAGADVAFARQVTAGHLTTNFTSALTANLNGTGDIYLAMPSYTFKDSFLGGQAQVLMAVPYGRGQASVDATLMGNLGLGGPGFTIGGSRSDTVTGFGDLIPEFNVRWNKGLDNFLAYLTGNIDVGEYNPSSLVNMGIGHEAIDAGGSYSYFDPKTGNEFSGTLGFTYNFENTHTQYQNGIDSHFDWGASHFLTKQLQVGAVGYAYQQLSCDSGSGDRLGCFESRVLGVGPQLGYIIPMGSLQGYLNLKAYKEFDADHRASGWNAWLTFAITPAAETPPATKRPMLTK